MAAAAEEEAEGMEGQSIETHEGAHCPGRPLGRGLRAKFAGALLTFNTARKWRYCGRVVGLLSLCCVIAILLFGHK